MTDQALIGSRLSAESFSNINDDYRGIINVKLNNAICKSQAAISKFNQHKKFESETTHRKKIKRFGMSQQNRRQNLLNITKAVREGKGGLNQKFDK